MLLVDYYCVLQAFLSLFLLLYCILSIVFSNVSLLVDFWPEMKCSSSFWPEPKFMLGHVPGLTREVECVLHQVLFNNRSGIMGFQNQSSRKITKW